MPTDGSVWIHRASFRDGTLRRGPLAKQLGNACFAGEIPLTFTHALQADEHGRHKTPTQCMRSENCSLNKLFLLFSPFGLLLSSMSRTSSIKHGFSRTILWPGRTSSRNNCFHLNLIHTFLYKSCCLHIIQERRKITARWKGPFSTTEQC